VVDSVGVVVEPREDAGTLYAKHREAHVELVRRQTGPLLSGTAPRTPQDHSRATFWERRTPEDGEIDWTRPAEEIDRLVRAVTRPFPGAWFETGGGKVTIWRAEPTSGSGEPPGTIVRRDREVTIACGAGALRVLEADGLPF
jgi:methionyl-tRNA formyltransferase